jgi:hypothetical protein
VRPAVLVRDVAIRSIIPTHTRYAELAGYQTIRARLLTDVAIARLDCTAADLGDSYAEDDARLSPRPARYVAGAFQVVDDNCRRGRA